MSVLLYGQFVRLLTEVAAYLPIAANAHAFSWDVLRLLTRPGSLWLLACVCRTGLSRLQDTMVCRKSVNFLPEPKR